MSLGRHLTTGSKSGKRHGGCFVAVLRAMDNGGIFSASRWSAGVALKSKLNVLLLVESTAYVE
jgi:hypothetical protein